MGGAGGILPQGATGGLGGLFGGGAGGLGNLFGAGTGTGMQQYGTGSAASTLPATTGGTPLASDTGGGTTSTGFPFFSGPTEKSSGNPLVRVPSNEVQAMQNWFARQIQNAGIYRDTDKLLGPATTGALDFFQKRLPEMLGQFPGFQKEISGAQGQIQKYQGQLGNIFNQMGRNIKAIPRLQGEFTNYSNQLGNMIPGIQSQVAGQQGQLGNIYGTLGSWLGAEGGPAGIIASGGALTPGLARDVGQQSRAIASAQGAAQGPGALGQELLNRDAYRQTRLAQAQQAGQSMLQQQAGVTGQESALTGLGSQLVSGILGQRAGITGQRGNLLGLAQNISQGMAGVTGQGAGLSGLLAGLTGQKAGLLGQEQALQTGGLNQLLNVGNASVNQYTGLTNPILSYLSTLYQGNQNAAISQAQIAAQQQASGDSKKAGGTSAIGSVIGAVLPLLFCDERLKANIKKTGLQTPEGIPIKTFEYKTRPGVPFVGVMAQDVEKKVPEAVTTEPLSGLKMLGFRFAPVQVKKEA